MAKMKDELATTGKLLAAVAAVGNPIAGLSGAAFFEVLSHHSAKKTTAFLQEIESRLNALEATGILEVNQLVEKEGFLGLLLTACAVAQRTQRIEKIQRIRNAVLFCSVHPPNPDEVDSFFHLIDQLTEEHFVILTVLRDHTDAFSESQNFADLYSVFRKYCTGLSFDSFAHYLSDLKYRRLVRLSPTIEDEDGLETVDLISTSQGKRGAMILISAVAHQLLDFTK